MVNSSIPIAETRTYASMTMPLSRMRSRTSARLDGRGARASSDCRAPIDSSSSVRLELRRVSPLGQHPAHGVVFAQVLPPVASRLYGRLEPLQSLDQRIGVLRVPNGGDGVPGHEPELEPPEPHAIPYADFRWRPLPVARRPVRERDDPFVELDFEPDFDRSRDPVFALVREPGLRATLSRSEEPPALALARFL